MKESYDARSWWIYDKVLSVSTCSAWDSLLSATCIETLNLKLRQADTGIFDRMISSCELINLIWAVMKLVATAFRDILVPALLLDVVYTVVSNRNYGIPP